MRVFRRPKSKRLTVEYRDEHGRRRRKTMGSDRKVAGQVALQLQARVDRILAGVEAPAAATRAIEEHVTDYVVALTARGRSPRHIQAIDALLRRIARECQWGTWSQIRRAEVDRAIVRWLDDGRAPRTINAYLAALNAFLVWMVQDSRADRNPLDKFRKLSQHVGVRRKRRALTWNETHRLIARTHIEGGLHHGLPGERRAWCYRVALETGFRAGEVRSLTPRSCRLHDTPPWIGLEAAASKRRRADRQPIREAFAADLARWLDDEILRDTLLFPFSKGRAAEMLKADLSLAEIEYETPDGVADFHALRHTFATRLVAAGAQAKSAQKLLRHSSITLTMDLYAHIGTEDLVNTVELLGGSEQTHDRSD